MTHSTAKPRVALPLGDPAGIGPEIVIKAMCDPELRTLADFILVGEVSAIEPHLKNMNVEIEITGSDLLIPGLAPVPIHEVTSLARQAWGLGQVSAISGKACYEYALAGINLAKSGVVDAVVAAPHTEAAVHQAGFSFSGYPNLVATATGTALDRTFLMLMSPVYRVVHVTLHESVASALNRLSEDLILNAFEATQEALLKLNMPEGRIGVCGINPHAGENGAMGLEDQRIVEPAVARAKKKGINVHGPFSADALFADREYDAYIAMYHDQGHVPVKAVSPRQASAITIGTPVLFGSVAHGSALNIAGLGKADPAALKQAIRNLTE